MGSEGTVDSLRKTNARLVDTLQQLQRERAGDALEGVLAEVDRAISGMLTYVEDLRRTREKLVRGVQSVADRLAEIDTRAVLGSGEAAQPPTQSLYAEQSTTVEPTSAAMEVEAGADVTAETVGVEAGADVAGIIRPETEPEAESAPAQPVHNEQPAMVEPASADDAEDGRARTSLPVDLVVHGCRNFELVGKLQAKVSGLAVVESMRVRRFHRGSLYMTVSHGVGDLAEGLAEAFSRLEVDGKQLQILESGVGRIEATFTG